MDTDDLAALALVALALLILVAGAVAIRKDNDDVDR